MPTRRKKQQVNRKLYLYLALSAVAVVALATTATVSSYRAAELKVRIDALEAFLKFQGVTEDYLASLESRLNSLAGLSPTQYNQRILAIATRVAELEQRLPYKVYNASSIQSAPENVAGLLYGTISGFRKTTANHLFIDVSDGSATTTITWFNCPHSASELGIAIGKAVAAYGNIKSYEGKKQIYVDSKNALFVE